MRTLKTHDAAAAEYVASADRYHASNPDAARRFRSAVSAAIETLRDNPTQWPLAPRVPERLGVRRVLVQGFPYSVVFMVHETETVVLAIAHGKRRPGYWLRRLTSAG